MNYGTRLVQGHWPHWQCGHSLSCIQTISVSCPIGISRHLRLHRWYEPFKDWEQFEHIMHNAATRSKDEEYKKLKDSRAQPIWEAIQKRAPDIVKGACTMDKVALRLIFIQSLPSLDSQTSMCLQLCEACYILANNRPATFPSAYCSFLHMASVIHLLTRS